MTSNPQFLLYRRYSISLVHQIPVEFVGDGCSHWHGHDFKFEVVISGLPDTKSGQILSTRSIDEIVERTILKPYTSQPLPQLQEKMTGESIAAEFFNRLRASEAFGDKVVALQMVETRKNRFQVLAPF